MAFAHCSGEDTKSEAFREDLQSHVCRTDAEEYCALEASVAGLWEPPPIRGDSVQQRETMKVVKSI